MARMLAPISSIKHYVQRSNTSQASGAISVHYAVSAVVAPAATNTYDVAEGSVVKNVFVEFWIRSNGGAGTSDQFNAMFLKTPSGVTDPSYAEILNLASYKNKKNVLFNTQGVVGDNTTGAVNVIRQWIKIPKGKQRCGFGDKFMFAIATTGQSLQTCGFFTYKEYK